MSAAVPRSTESIASSMQLEADDIDDANDGVTDEELSTASLQSSIREFQVRNGRGYHKNSEYWLPGDEQESARLDLQNHQLLLTFDGRKYFSPDADKAKRVLDVGTGTGIWAIDFADEHPNAQVIGVDIAPIQPSFSPPNVRFEVDDVDKEWTWTEKFDYIFVRMLVGSLPSWERFMKQAWDNLEPGGWIEFQDPGFPMVSDDGTLPDDSPLRRYDDYVCRAARNLGRPMDVAVGHHELLRRQGFVNVERKDFKWPSNTWPRHPRHKEVGLWTLANISGNLDSISNALFSYGLGMTQDEIDAFLVGVRRDLKDRRIHAYWPVYVTIAQKPLK